MTKIYSYIIRVDDGAAPNPYGDICTLTICKPKIRKAADEGDWIIGTGSKNIRLRDGSKHDFSKSLVYAMKVTDKKTLPEYDKYCLKYLKIKIPNWKSKQFDKKMGDCIYDYAKSNNPIQRDGIHGKSNKRKDISGKYSLLSKYFYYFGSEPKLIPKKLYALIHTTQGHKIFTDAKNTHKKSIKQFEEWISKFDGSGVFPEPQLKYRFENNADKDCRISCSNERLKNDTKDKAICAK